MPRRATALLVIGLGLLGVAWMFSTPPFAAPDEPAQYLRALSLSQGRLFAPHVPLAASDVANLHASGWEIAQERWNLHDRRGVSVPAALSPPGEPCLDGRADLTGRCTEVTYTGDYYPLAYVLPAAGVAVSSGWRTALWLARTGSLIGVLLCLGFAVAATGLRRFALLGLLAAATPTALFIGSVLNPSGLEIAANLAVLAGLLRLGHDPPGWVWIGLGLSCAIAVFAWQLGPLFVAVDLVVWAIATGPAGVRALWARRRGPMLAVAGAIAAAVVVFLVYGRASGVVHSTITFAAPGPALKSGVRQLWLALQGAVGDFGALTVKLPAGLIVAWGVVASGLVGAALVLGRPREQIALVTALAVGLGFPVAFYAFSYRVSGFGLQGRYILPLLAPAPMLAGAALDRAATRGHARLLTSAGLGALALLILLQLAAWWVNAHHWARSGGVLLSPAAWVPPLGWAPWLVAALLGCGALLVAARWTGEGSVVAGS